MDLFFDTSKEVDVQIKEIADNTALLEQLYPAIVYAIKPNANNNNNFNQLKEKTDKLIRTAHTKLAALKEQKINLTKTEDKMCTNQYQHLVQKLMNQIKNYEELLQTTKTKYEGKLNAERKIIGMDASVETNNTTNDNFFAAKILDPDQKNKSIDASTYIKNKHLDIMQLEQNIAELHQLFLDMAILVESQSELIDSVEINVNQSVSDTKDGVKDLKVAVILQKKSRKKLCCLLVGLGIIIVVISVPILTIFLR